MEIKINTEKNYDNGKTLKIIADELKKEIIINNVYEPSKYDDMQNVDLAGNSTTFYSAE